MAPDDHPDDEQPEAGDQPAAAEEEPAVESEAMVKLRELRERMRGQFDSLHSEIESLRRPLSERAASADTGESPAAVEPDPVEPPAEADPVEAPAEPEPDEPQPPEPVEAGSLAPEPIDQPEPIEEPEPEPDEPEPDLLAGGDDGLDLAAAGAGVDPGIFYAPAEVPGPDIDPQPPAAGPGMPFDVEAEGWLASTDADGSPEARAVAEESPRRARGPAPADAGIERGAHGLPDWVFGAHEDQPAPFAAVPPGQVAAGTAAPQEGPPWEAGAPWPEASPLGDAEGMFSSGTSAIRRVVTAVLVFALVVALVILVIQLLDDGESTDPVDSSAPAGLVEVVAPPL